MKKTVLAIVAAAAPLMAAEPAGIKVWKSADLKAYQKSLSPKINEKKVALESLGNFGNHSVLVAHREGDGEAELHDVQADFFFVQTGQATLVLGGEVENGRTTAPVAACSRNARRVFIGPVRPTACPP